MGELVIKVIAISLCTRKLALLFMQCYCTLIKYSVLVILLHWPCHACILALYPDTTPRNSSPEPLRGSSSHLIKTGLKNVISSFRESRTCLKSFAESGLYLSCRIHPMRHIMTHIVRPTRHIMTDTKKLLGK